DDRIAWYENRLDEASADFGPQQTIPAAARGACSVFAVDLDGDGDQDVLSASFSDHKIAWYENRLGEGIALFGAPQTITTAAEGACSVFAVDLDGDGDQDVLSASYIGDGIAWYENRLDEASVDFGPQQTITTAANFAYSVFATDVDGDGDQDVLSASRYDDRIAWYENRLDEASADFGPQQTITTAADGARSVFASDLDGDGDQDVLSASTSDDRIAWYENRLDEAGADFGPQQTITTFADGAYSVFAADLDGDGDNDVLSASSWDDRIAWYENLTPVSRISFGYVSSREGWKPYGYPGFSSPVFGNTLGDPGTLDTTMTDNTNQVGLWQSPGFEVVAPGETPTRTDTEKLAGVPGTSIFSATYRVMTDETDPTRVPQFRLRTTSGTGQKSEVLSIESHFDGAYSPTPEGRDYTLTFQPSANDSVFECYFDLLNFYPQDSATATVLLDRVEVKPIADLSMESARLDRIYPFFEGQDGWQSYTIPGVFAEPTFAYDQTNSRLGISIADTDDFQFGFWGSTIDPANNVTIEPDYLYWAIFTVGTDITDPQRVPEFRLRLNESMFRASQYTNIAATGSAAGVPTAGNAKEYTVFFPPNMGAGGNLLCSFDLLANPSRQLLDVGSSIYLERVEVLSQPLVP
ncbi:VCBS repeat-containing protein, partial [bacterium]|nr:VCBS repeat-containing protein [bacterium]